MTQLQLFDKLKYYFPNILLAGSSLLKYHKLTNRKIGDLDIICETDNVSFIRFCKALRMLFPVAGGYSYYTNNPNCVEHIQFSLKGVKVCVFTCSKSHFNTIKSKKFVSCVTLENLMELKNFYISRLDRRHSSYKKHYDDLQILINVPEYLLG